MDRPISSSASLPTLSPNVKNEKNEKSERLECTCKYLQLNLSTTTAAEYGDLNSLTHRLSSSHNNNRNNIKITPGNTPLHLSAQHGHVAMTSYLLENGYDPNTGLLVSQSSAVVPKQDDKDRYTATPTPIHRACHSGALGCIQLLLQAHADILIPDFSFGDGMNAMHKAVKGGRPLAVILLLDYLISSSSSSLRGKVLTSRDSKNRTPLQIAKDSVKKGPEEISSLRRWDVVAGGLSANFEECVRLLEREEIASFDDDDGDNDGRGHLGLEQSMGNESNEGECDDTAKSLVKKQEGPSKNTVGEDQTPKTSWPTTTSISIPNSSSLPNAKNVGDATTFGLLCDCDKEIVGDDGATERRQCKTAVWETAFQNALFKSTMATLAPITRDRNNVKNNADHNQRQSDKVDNKNDGINVNLLTVQESKRIQSQDMNDDGGSESKIAALINQATTKGEIPVIGSIPQIEVSARIDKKGEYYDHEAIKNQNVTNYSTNKMMKKTLGQPCSKCEKGTLTLFRDDTGNLVCRSCLKQARVRRY